MKALVCTIFLSMILSDKLPNDVRWVRESNEYKALCNQVYGQAIYKIKKKMTYNKFSLNQ